MKSKTACQNRLRLDKKDGSDGRVTTVDPLPVRLLRRACARADELDGISARQLAKFQTQKEPQ